ncbi:metacaspase type I [Raphidocelis subcapitata]|uniref:Metacaspase type I n=1 Tax=Raphidocelis subcapitata TaxID=307507 RepID=A0A2V0PFG6_9CHLO|nr:metacaspase type I [Raphidocelis subcapitata]|eukprot:GBF96663.1 metacaspase type I [Raphidocelis subcapitata]
MGLMDKLAKKAEQLATKLAAEMDKTQAQQQQGGGGAGGSGYAAPTVYQQQHGAYTPPGYQQSAPQQQQVIQEQQQYLAPTTYSPNPQGPQAGRKKAVLVGISYVGTRSHLRGTINDVMCMRHCLMTRFGFPEASIVMLRDDVQHPDFYPTRANIFRACQWLTTDMQFGDSLFFHYSGHGGQLRDPTGMEDDGMDETILPADHKTAGQIRDTELHRALAAPLPQGVVLHALFDSCHSGSILDLPYETRYDQSGAAYWKASRMFGTSGGTAFQLGACDDQQTAADTAAMSRSAYTGAATYSFIDSIERYGVEQTYANLLIHMTQSLRALGKSSISNPNGGSAALTMAAPMLGAMAMGPMGALAGALLGSAMDTKRMSHQLPVLACDKPVDIHQIQLMI